MNYMIMTQKFLIEIMNIINMHEINLPYTIIYPNDMGKILGTMAVYTHGLSCINQSKYINPIMTQIVGEQEH
ncbi:hypothetical protein IX307_000850 [Bacteroides pyogenes]|nr:hypothetical protein [Bacteroides pyogenes]MBR8786541.1 hypothetical protein [Bacteroides pyogenes]MBR8792024.1 hypothetical protein [Bacteroides pyogenes]